jgi:glycosyltransferase involved in cell wall biosynthesis
MRASETEETTKASRLVSVIIPTYNRAAYLTAAIDSVLAQTYRPLQLIVVDDGSTDNTAALVQRYSEGVEYIRQPQSGAGAARNRGLAAAAGNFIAFLDSDDLWLPEKAERQVGLLDENPEIEAVFSQVQMFFSPELEEQERQGIWCPDQPMPGYLPGTMLIRRSSFLRVGQFETKWAVGEFMSWYLRACEAGLRSMVMEGCLYLRRVHKTNKGRVSSDQTDQRFEILKASLDRRRGSG